MQTNLQFQSDLDKLVAILPQKVRKHLDYEKMSDVIEIVLDIGRIPEIRHANGEIEYIECDCVDDEDILHITSRVQEFTSDNRSGIPGTLHRISAIRNRQGKVVGLTCRIGRVVTGTIACIKDFCTLGKSILFLGPPGVGKTTKLREISRLVADELKKRVIVVDTSNEIAGDGDTPHPAIGHARRMQVRQPEFQKDIMIEAVENHTPEVIVVDEIGTEAEAQAARTIAERGVMLIATAHGNTLENLIKNPSALIYDNAIATTIYPDSRGDVELLYDLGVQSCGYYTFRLKAPAGTILDINQIEYIRPDGKIQGTGYYRNTMRYITKEGVNEMISIKRRSGRYIFLTLREMTGPVEIQNFHVIESTYPVEYKGDFQCSDTRLSEIWDIPAVVLILQPNH